MKFTFLLALCLACLSKASSQVVISDYKSTMFNNGFLPSVGGLPASDKRTIEISDGTIYFQNDWAKSKVVSENLNIYRDVSIKIDLMEDKIHYLDSTGKDYIVGTPLRQISFIQSSSGKEVHFINGQILPVQKTGWYLLLFNDSLSLVKGFKKTFQTHTSYGSAPEYSIKTDESYFLYVKGKEYEVKKPADFTDAIPSKKEEIEAFIKTLSKKNSKEEQLTAVATYCNSFLK